MSKVSDSYPILSYPILSYLILSYHNISIPQCRRRCCGTIRPYPFCADISPHPGIPYTLYSIPYTVYSPFLSTLSPARCIPYCAYLFLFKLLLSFSPLSFPLHFIIIFLHLIVRTCTYTFIFISREQFLPLLSAAEAIGVRLDISSSKTLADTLDLAVKPEGESCHATVSYLIFT